MVLAAYFAASLLLTTAFVVTEKKLHPFEILAVWMAVLSVNSVLSSFLLFNLKWIEIGEGSEVAIARILYKLVLTPLTVVWFIDRLQMTGSMALRLAGPISAFILLLAGGWLLENAKAVIFSSVGWWGYAGKEAALIVIALFALYVIRLLMRKDGYRHAPVSRLR